MAAVIEDLRFAGRMVRRAPGFAVVAVATLGLGIGASTALFSVVNGVLLEPLPYVDAGRLVAVYAKTAGFERAPVTYLNFLDWQREARTFESMAIYRNEDHNITGGAQAERVAGQMISAGFFPTLGVRPVLGRTFDAGDDRVGAAPVAILGGGYWRRKFGGSRGVIGSTVLLDGTPYVIVGVMPAEFTFYGRDRDVYTPIGQWDDPSFRDRRISVSAYVVGRLKTGVTVGQAQAGMNVVARNLAAEYPVADKESGIAVVSMKEDIVGNVRPYLMVLLTAVGFLLLIACGNVANLLLARSMGRAREFAVRAALGAGTLRLVRQLLTESGMLVGMGGALGLALAYWGTKAVVRLMPGTLPRAEEISLDGRVLIFAVGVSVAAGILFGLAPALKSSRVSLQEVLRENGRGVSGARHVAQRVFVAVEVGMAVVLLAAAGLMLRSLAALWRVDPGYRPRHAITFNLSMPSSPGTTSAETRARLRQFDTKLRSISGVRAVSVTLGSRPMIHDSSLPFWIDGRPKPANDNEMPQAMFYLVEAGFEQAMGIRLERGRFVTPADDEHSRVVIDIDDAFARRYFPGQDPVGKRVYLTQFNVPAEIVGVVGHVKQWGLGQDSKSAVEAEFFYPFMQLPEKLMPMVAGGVAVVLRTEGDPARVMGRVREGVAEVDRRDVIYSVRTMEEVLDGSLAARRLSMMLLEIFAGLAVVLAGVGIYGVVSYVTGQRVHEIGVRMALGARRRDVMLLVVGEGAKMTLAGVAAGVCGALGLTRLMASELYGVSAHDPVTFGAAAVVLVGVAVLACYVPARRAVRVDPGVALRWE